MHQGLITAHIAAQSCSRVLLRLDTDSTPSNNELATVDAAQHAMQKRAGIWCSTICGSYTGPPVKRPSEMQLKVICNHQGVTCVKERSHAHGRDCVMNGANVPLTLRRYWLLFGRAAKSLMGPMHCSTKTSLPFPSVTRLSTG